MVGHHLRHAQRENRQEGGESTEALHDIRTPAGGGRADHDRVGERGDHGRSAAWISHKIAGNLRRGVRKQGDLMTTLLQAFDEQRNHPLYPTVEPWGHRQDGIGGDEDLQDGVRVL